MSRLRWILSRLRRTLWIRVSLYALMGFAAAVAATLASWLPWPLPIDISAEAIDSLLNVIASSMLAVTTFSVTALTSAYGSATSNATPRATRLLTEDDTPDFCHKVSLALSKGWALHGPPTMAFDAARGVMRCAQAVTKEVAADYTPDMKLGEQ